MPFSIREWLPVTGPSQATAPWPAADAKWDSLEVVTVVIEHLHSEVYVGL